jgi:hypothetical protein
MPIPPENTRGSALDHWRHQVAISAAAYLIVHQGRALGTDIARAIGVGQRSLRSVLQHWPDTFHFSHTRAADRRHDRLVVALSATPLTEALPAAAPADSTPAASTPAGCTPAATARATRDADTSSDEE